MSSMHAVAWLIWSPASDPTSTSRRHFQTLCTGCR